MNNDIKSLLSDKLIRKYALIALILLCGLLTEFITLFGYGALKIIRYLVLVAGLFVIAWIDRKEHLIYNKHLLILLLIRLALLVAEWILYPEFGMGMLISAFMGLLLGGGVFWLCYLVSRGGMGAGDVKLMAVVGFYIGNNIILPAMVVIVVTSAIYNGVKLLLKRTSMKEEIPFAPFVLIGTIITMALGF